MSTDSNRMEYIRLGKSGMKVSRIILGCMSYGTPEWRPWVLKEEEAVEHIKVAYDLGINAFDTANVYSAGMSEIVLGKAIKKWNLPRDEIVVMTKVFFTVGREPGVDPGDMTPDQRNQNRFVNQGGLSRKHIFESIKHSLERLQLDYVDLLQCHRFDPETPVEETMHALHDVVKAGYARYIGMSSCYAWQFAKMQFYARAHGLTEFVSMQNRHNATYREEEREMTSLLQDLDVGMTPYSPLAMGFLARPHKEQSLRGQTDKYRFLIGDVNAETFLVTINERIETIAKTHGVSMAQVGIAWSLSKPFVTAPIVGTTSLDKLRDLVGGIHLKLSAEEIKSIDDLYQPRKIAGH